MTEETRWIESIKPFKCDVRLLEHCNGVSLYKVQRRAMCIYPDTVDTYSVWAHDEHICSTTNYLDAVQVWDREASE